MYPDNPKTAAALNRCTFAEFVSMVQPQAPWEGLRVAVYLNMWLFLWDDCEAHPSHPFYFDIFLNSSQWNTHL